MRISDWSSDVCSSDLGVTSIFGIDCGGQQNAVCGLGDNKAGLLHFAREPRRGQLQFVLHLDLRRISIGALFESQGNDSPAQGIAGGGHVTQMIDRSEEHPSELQSLMRIPYAVFCL